MKQKVTLLKQKKGVALVLVVFMCAFFALTILAILKRIPESHRTSIIVEKSNRALYMADSGIEASLAQLREDPNNLSDISYTETGVGKYEVTLVQISPSPTRIVEAISTGTLEKTGPSNPSEKRIIAEIETDSPGEYFGASNSDLIIAGGTNISQGKLYARNLTFQKSGDVITVQSASYSNYCNYFDTDFDKKHIRIIDPNPDGNYEPWQDSTKIFPRLDSAKLEYYKMLASLGDASGIISKDTFKNAADIYPPNNGNHLYFCSGDMEIQGNIHGQIVFVSTGTITFTGNITYGVVEDKDGNPLTDPCTTAGFFCTENVLIDSNAPDDLNINGLIIAPYGQFKAESNSGANDFAFFGGFIVKDGVNIAGVYTGTRTYAFDINLKNNPLPHMPYMANLKSWKEK